jgi:SAM-dependent methyltransferase
VGDVAALAFPDQSFDLVVSTLSMHHWADPTAGLAEIGRVLRPGGRALIWDFRPGVRPHPFGPRHAQMPDPVDHTRSSPRRVVNTTPWPWPWRFRLTQRIELVRADRSPSLNQLELALVVILAVIPQATTEPNQTVLTRIAAQPDLARPN